MRSRCTDILIDVVQNIRREVIALGGEVRFGHRLERLNFACGRLTGAVVHCAENEYTLPCERLILAIGHSARDTFENLNAQGVPMQPKPFSMGAACGGFPRAPREHRRRRGEAQLPPGRGLV